MNGSGERKMTQAAKVALLVGAGDAIGAAVARRFARGGFAICIARRESAKSQALVEEIGSEGGEARAYSTDVRKEENVKALFAEVVRDVGPIEVCLHGQSRDGWTHELDLRPSAETW
jgi:NAD(P)-dependent dehydrogenase (short-subunit alcohol dehydrogenase family)